MHYRVTVFFLWLIFKIFGRIEYQGRENFPPQGTPFLFCSNHDTYLDPPILAVTCRHRLGFLAKEELFTNKFFGFLIYSLGAIPLDRNAGDVRAIRTALKILKTKPMVVFPQGTRGRTLYEYDAGAGFLAKKANVPVIAAHIYGAENILPKGKKFLSFSKIRVVVGKVDNIVPADTYEEISAKIMAKIRSL
jgi:1-acyl-sn-glycerol-3-phosphate acyltransferase